MKKQLNRGIGYKRTEFDYQSRINMEKVFADEWEGENTVEILKNQGQGLLQNLFIKETSWLHDWKIIKRVRRFDRVVAATVVQWLGSNVGFCFLRSTLKKCGYDLVPTKGVKWCPSCKRFLESKQGMYEHDNVIHPDEYGMVHIEAVDFDSKNCEVTETTI